MRSIELTLDEATDAAFRAGWESLLLTGLPSQARHTGASNRPTDPAGADPDPLEDDRVTASRRSRLLLLSERLAALPLALAFSGLVVFGAPPRGLVLARLVVPSRALLEMHAEVHAAAPGATELTAPDRWTPHVTLAHRLTPDQLAHAVTLVTDAPEGSATGARLWDSGTREITALV